MSTDAVMPGRSRHSPELRILLVGDVDDGVKIHGSLAIDRHGPNFADDALKSNVLVGIGLDGEDRTQPGPHLADIALGNLGVDLDEIRDPW